MWTRALLKSNAKNALRGKFWPAFAVCFIAGCLGGGGSIGGTIGAASGQLSDGLDRLSSESSALVALVIVLVTFIAVALSFAFVTFVGGPIKVGKCRYMMENRIGNAPFDTLFSAFKTPYLNVVKVHLLVTLKIWIGSLIIIPGIIWTYKYAMVPYLLAENPYMPIGRAMELSGDMMEGEKFNFWVLQISFIGWYLLSIFTLCIGAVFITPYCEATFAEFYAAMRAKAFSAGMTDASELGDFYHY